MKYRSYTNQMIKSLHDEKRMRVDSGCKILGVSRSGYYKWRDAMPAKSQVYLDSAYLL